jgi:uncharacterized protein Veg
MSNKLFKVFKINESINTHDGKEIEIRVDRKSSRK